MAANPAAVHTQRCRMKFAVLVASFAIGSAVALRNAKSDRTSVPSSSSSSSSEDIDDTSSVGSHDGNAAHCVTCPLTRIRKPHCSKGTRPVMLERTCYTCMKQTCLPKKIVHGEEKLICNKKILHCDCDDNETCVRIPRTEFRCEEIVCIPKINTIDEIRDREMR